MPITQGGANLFFQLVNARYEKGAIILTFNRGFAEWGDVFGDPVVATALLDRLLHHAVVVQIEGVSYRVKGQCLDKAPMESFFASLKKELVHRQCFKTRLQAKAAIFEYIAVFYNRQRRYSAIRYRTPQPAYEDRTWKTAA